jgi:hypothetical protein
VAAAGLSIVVVTAIVRSFPWPRVLARGGILSLRRRRPRSSWSASAGSV